MEAEDDLVFENLLVLRYNCARELFCSNAGLSEMLFIVSKVLYVGLHQLEDAVCGCNVSFEQSPYPKVEFLLVCFFKPRPSRGQLHLVWDGVLITCSSPHNV